MTDKNKSSPTRSTVVSPTSPQSSCGSNDINQDDNNNNHGVISVVVGCSHCLMYMMIDKGEIKCPKCNNTNLIHFPNDNKKRG
ncbi:hypothetical protein HKD37_16G044728 [Glycine soja]